MFKADTTMQCPPGCPTDNTPCTEDGWHCEDCECDFNDLPLLVRAWRFFTQWWKETV